MSNVEREHEIPPSFSRYMCERCIHQKHEHDSAKRTHARTDTHAISVSDEHAHCVCDKKMHLHVWRLERARTALICHVGHQTCSSLRCAAIRMQNESLARTHTHHNLVVVEP